MASLKAKHVAEVVQTGQDLYLFQKHSQLKHNHDFLIFSCLPLVFNFLLYVYIMIGIIENFHVHAQ